MKTFWWVAGGAALLAAAAAPFELSNFSLGILTTAAVFAILALSLDLLLGHGGRPSLGHAAFFGIGGYAVALLAHAGIANPLLCALAGVGATALAAVLLGPVMLRTRDIYFLMVTLAISELLRNLAISWRSLTFGDDGISSVDIGTVAGVDFGNPRNFYFLALGSLVIVMALMAIITCAPFGHVLRALRDNHSRITVFGVNPFAVEVVAFVISAGLAGFAGVLFAYEKAFVSPTLFSVETSAQALLMAVIGGASTLAGPVIGALAVELVRGVGSIYTERWQTVLGLLAVLVALNSRNILVRSVLHLLGPVLPRHTRGARPMQAPAMPCTAPTQAPAAATPPIPDPTRPPVAAPARGTRIGPLLAADCIVKGFGGLTVFDGVSLSVAPGERRGLIGPNGAGKTTLLNILSGVETPTSGRIKYNGTDITALPAFRRARLGIGRTFQIGNLFNDRTTRENIVLALLAREGYAFRFGRPLGLYRDLRREASELIDQWSLHDIGDVPVKLLSYGRRRVIEIVLAVAMRPRLLLLDEPAAGLSGAETKKIIETIGALNPDLSLLLVEHDMDLVFSICDQVTVLANGAVLAEGQGEAIRRDPRVVDAYLGMSL